MRTGAFAVYSACVEVAALRALLVLASTALTACAPVRISEGPGTFGTLIYEDSGQRVVGGTVCQVGEPKRCTTSGPSGEFDLKPWTRTKWMFIMIESFPDAAVGAFRASADGYAGEEFQADHLRHVTVALRRNK